MKVKFTILEEVTLRQWIKHKYPHITYNRLQQGIRNGDVRVNGEKMSPQFSLKPGDICEIWEKLLLNTPKPIPKDLKADVIAKNQNFWVFDKPYGIASQKGKGIDFSMIEIATSMMGKPAYCVHRLDRYTTGILIMACDSYAARDLSLGINDWKKTYLAKIAPGDYPLEGTISESVYEKLAITNYKILRREVNENKGKQENNPAPRSRAEKAPSYNHALVKFTPLTGRMHQIRWHSATHLKPILGDIKFGSDVRTKMYLRCIGLEFSFRGERYKFSVSP